MQADADAGCGPGAGGDSVGLLAEFRTWLDQERGLSAESVRCYCSQAKSFVAATGGPGAVSGLDAGMVTAFMVEHLKDRNGWSAKAMVTSLPVAGEFDLADREQDAFLAVPLEYWVTQSELGLCGVVIFVD